MALLQSFKYCLLILFVTYLSTSPSYGEPLIVSLDGTDWVFTNDAGDASGRATVPGGIYSDLVASGRLPEDPLFRSNDVAYRWVARENWTFSKVFNVTQEILSRSSVSLVLHGVDTISKVSVNDKLIGETKNMFVRYKFDIKAVLRPGDNKITISIESPLSYSKRKASDYIKSNLYVVPPFCPTEIQQGECHANFVRKMQCSFSWDWGPAIPSSGIWRSAEIEAADQLVLRDVMATTSYAFNEGQWYIDVTGIFESSFLNGPPLSVRIELRLQNFTLAIFNSTLRASPLDSLYKLKLRVPVSRTPFPILLWWPNGAQKLSASGLPKDLGRALYNLTLIATPRTPGPSARQRHGDITVSKTVRIGFRTLELVQQPISPAGTTFYFKVNGVAMFMKGANWIPANVQPERTTDEYLRTLLTSARDANMNMLRVWGGGIYESERFYELSDELGILIWQDMMFACALFPTDADFLATVSTEVTQQVQRLQSHPSIAVWAGNNENEAAIAQMWWPEIAFRSKTYRKDYVQLYITTMKGIFEKEDPGRAYLSSSPSNGDETQKENWISADPQDVRYGDVHFYDYSPSGWDWTIYPSSKFTSEYGFQSFPSLSAWLGALNSSSELTFPISSVGEVAHRQHSLAGGAGIDLLTGHHLKLPAFGGVERFMDFVYESQIAQAMTYKAESEFYRRNRMVTSSGGGFTMGALYWQLNDVWVAPTWASIEYGGKWKMVHYFAKNFFEALIAVPYIDNGYFTVDIVNDVLQDIPEATLTVMVYKWNSFVPSAIKTLGPMALSTGKVTRVLSRPLSDVLEAAACQDQSGCVVRTVLTISNSSQLASSDNFLLLASPKDSAGIIKSTIRVVNIAESRTVRGWHSKEPAVYTIDLEANAISLFVWLDFGSHLNIGGRFSDNGFMMFEQKRKVQFFSSNPNITKDVIATNLVVRSLTDVES